MERKSEGGLSVAPVPAGVRQVEIFALLHVNTSHGGEEAKGIGSVNSTVGAAELVQK